MACSAGPRCCPQLLARRPQALARPSAGLVAPRTIRAATPARAIVVAAAAAVEDGERLRLHNLSPQTGSRRDEMRKGRGYGGHQVRTA